MSMKCRCGSDDKLILKAGAIVRKVDSLPHVCMGQEKPTTFDKEVKPESTITEYTRKQNLILEEMEHVLIEENPELKNNVQKLGMKMKIIYQGMPLELKYNSSI